MSVEELARLIHLTKRKYAFVFFPTGAGGNFIAKLISGVQFCKKDIVIHSSGHAHFTDQCYPVRNWLTNVSSPKDWHDASKLLATLSENQWKAELENPGIDVPVFFSHIGSTIPKVTEMCPNAKILVITIVSEEEKLASALLGSYKFALIPDRNSSRQFQKSWEENKIDFLRMLGLSELVVADVIANRFDEKYRDLLAWGEVVTNKTEIDKVHYENVPHIKLPLSAILRKDSDVLLSTIQQCFDEELTNTQKEYIFRNFDTYHAAQIQDLMKDPIEYTRQLEERAKKRVEELKGAELFFRKHIFVFFPSGASGTFIGKLISGLRLCKKDIKIHPSGHAHINDAEYPVCGWMRKPEFFGDWHDATKLLSTFSEKQWKAQLGNPGNKVDHPVHLSHVGSTISKVTEICPNAKILVITIESMEEKLASELLSSYKVTLTPGVTSLAYDEEWARKTSTNLSSYGIDESIISDVVHNRFDEKYKDIIVWSEAKENPSEINSTHYENIPHIKLPFSVILKKDTHTLIEVIQQCFDKELTSTQKEYIFRNLDAYHAAQIQDLMKDPMEYTRQLGVKSRKKVEELRGISVPLKIEPPVTGIGVFSKIKQWIKNTLP